MLEVRASPVRSSRLIVIFVVALLVAVLTLGVAGLRTAFADGPGGLCQPNGPACTTLSHDAFVDFEGLAADGCTFVDASVQALQITTMPGNETATYVFVIFSEFDNCTGTFIASASNQDPSTGLTVFNGSAQFSTPVGSASVTGTAPMFDTFGNPSTWMSTIDITWQGYGPTTTSTDIFREGQPGVFFTLSHNHGTSQNAVTTGVFTDEAGNNLAAVPALDALIANGTGGFVVVVKS
jgi:hypothetical protein